ncbi:MAG: transglutaminase-like cysteine peptidase [Devosia sp.]
MVVSTVSASHGGLVSRSNAWRLAISGAIFALLSLTAVTPAQAASVPVPRGFEIMCIDFPAECRGGGASQVPYDAKLQALLQKVNAKVNRSISPVKNEVIDVWSINVTKGDCEDYVLAKRRALISAGVPASALSIVYALRNGGGHAVLAVHTDNGSYALDNMTAKIKPLWSTGYKLISMSGPNPRVWMKVPRALYARN